MEVKRYSASAIRAMTSYEMEDRTFLVLASDYDALQAQVRELEDGAFQAHEQYDADQDELTRLRAEVERLTKEREAERKRIAEAVENVEIVSWKDNLDGTTDCLPNYGAVNELRDRIEHGEFAKEDK